MLRACAASDRFAVTFVAGGVASLFAAPDLLRRLQRRHGPGERVSAVDSRGSGAWPIQCRCCDGNGKYWSAGINRAAVSVDRGNRTVSQIASRSKPGASSTRNGLGVAVGGRRSGVLPLASATDDGTGVVTGCPRTGGFQESLEPGLGLGSS